MAAYLCNEKVPLECESFTGGKWLDISLGGAATGMPEFSWTIGGLAVSGDEAGSVHHINATITTNIKRINNLERETLTLYNCICKRQRETPFLRGIIIVKPQADISIIKLTGCEIRNHVLTIE